VSDPVYLTVFDIQHAPYAWWVPAIGLGFAALAVLNLIIRSTGLAAFLPRTRSVLSPWAMLGFSLFWTGCVLFVTGRPYLNGRAALAGGRARVVEGVVEHFVPMPENGKEMERFVVAGVPFSYSRYAASPGFRTTRPEGGPIHDGLRVRIHYLGNDILRLEVAPEK
jgi:hypothetical protein